MQMSPSHTCARANRRYSWNDDTRKRMLHLIYVCKATVFAETTRDTADTVYSLVASPLL